MLKETLYTLMEENQINIAELSNVMSKMNTVDIADIFEDLSKEKTIQIYRLLPKNIAADVFSYIVPEKQQIIIEALTDLEIGKIMSELFVDDAVDFIEEMPAGVVTRVLKNTDAKKRTIINQILRYPEDSVGSIMTTEFVDLKEDITVQTAFEKIRKIGVNKETIYTCYVISHDRLLIGVISAKTLLLAEPHDKVGDIMDSHIIFTHTTDDQEELANQFRKYDLLSIPVVDKEQRLVGIVTIDDVIDIIEEENTEDFEKMAALNPSDDPYMRTGIFKQASNRIIWLLVLMLSATITGSIIAGFEDALSDLTILVTFFPLLMGTGGNAGSQASTLIIRGLALNEIKTNDLFKVLVRELSIGLICGAALGVVNFIRIYLTSGRDVMLSFTVTLSLMATVLLAKCVGCLLPLGAKKLKLDPAIMAAPLITTIVDAASLSVFFTIAKIFLLKNL